MNTMNNQGFIPDPSKSQVATLTGTKTFKKGAGGDVNITTWRRVKVVPVAAATYYYNTDTTKTFPLLAGLENLIWVGQGNVTQVVLVLGATTASVQGM